MDVPKKIVYADEAFWLQTTGRYYQSGRKDALERLLHRRIYADHYGPIPPGFQVHHVNGDWQDNQLENLVLVSTSEHAREHLAARMATPEGQASTALGLARGRAGAKRWHSSQEGRAWHAHHSKKTWEHRVLTPVHCVVCGQGFETVFPSRTYYCSDVCYHSATYQRHKTASGVCPRCGTSFVYNKYRKQTYCSRRCGILARSEARKL